MNSQDDSHCKEDILKVFSGEVYGLVPAITYILDFKKLKYWHFSKNVLDYTGYPAEEFLAKGPYFAYNLFHPEDLAPLAEIQQAQRDFLSRLPPQEYKQYRFTYSYRFKKADGQYSNFLNQEIFLLVDKNNNPLLSYGIISDITHLKKDAKMSLAISKADNTQHTGFMTNLLSLKSQNGILSTRELDVLRLIMEGLSTAAIADKLHISPYTVKNRRRSMLTKTNAKNMAEVIRYATTKGLL